MTSVERLFTISLVFVLSACSHTAPRYGVSADNVENLRKAASSEKQKIALSSFTSFEPGLSTIMCRGAGPVEPPDGQTFEKYIEGALASELKIAGLFASESGTKLQGKLEYITFNSNIFAGKWQIDMTFSGESVKPFTINTVYSFSTNFAANIACNQVAQALPAAVQEVISKLVSHPSFQALAGGKSPM